MKISHALLPIVIASASAMELMSAPSIDRAHNTQVMLKAMETEDNETAIRALRSGADPNSHFIYTNRVENPGDVIKWCLHDREVFWHDKPALSEVASNGNLKLAQALIEAGANVNIKDPCGQTRLMWAVVIDSIRNNTAVTQCLLDHGAKVNLTNSEGYTALSLALDNDKKSKVVSLLKNHGAMIARPLDR